MLFVKIGNIYSTDIFRLAIKGIPLVITNIDFSWYKDGEAVRYEFKWIKCHR